eukprot:CAMPEP_0198277408 /NCGR_PEP_ID=MMETSP1447-20131203/65834_1 /TAXON_ID=420782 /ORGANISM="Chaetoceros dichaeta, Strain CCMP1751" /LENGTH=274 /DNA_ID=CAMNT_0043972427 /DNA_START=167 /DNA_END=991 /DNA_ORIENTATION=+
MVKEDECTSISMCFSWVFATFLDFSRRENENLSIGRILFGVMIVIVLLNVVIAIVSEAWTTASLQSTKLFWKYRVTKIAELKVLDNYSNRTKISNSSLMPASLQSTKLFWKYRLTKIAELKVLDNYSNRVKISNSRLMRSIDRLENIAYSTDISWSKAPYSSVTKKAHYDKPHEYLPDETAAEIIKAKSLQNDLYWARKDALHHGVRFTNYNRITLILKWLGSCALYASLIIMGIFTCGIFFPRNFRYGLLTVGFKKKADTPKSSHMVEKEHTD